MFKKRILLLMMSFCMASEWVSAQTDSFMWGLTGGVNITKTNGEGKGFLNTGWDTNAGGGYWIGLQIRMSLPLIGLGLDASIDYSQEQATLYTSGGYASDKLRYFTFPVHVRYDLEVPGICDVIVPFAFIGPELNLALNDYDWYGLVHQNPEALEAAEEAYNANQNMTAKRLWKLDMGFGGILFGHLQLAYNYAIPLNSAFSFGTAYTEGKNNFKMGTHRIGLTYFF